MYIPTFLQGLFLLLKYRQLHFRKQNKPNPRPNPQNVPLWFVKEQGVKQHILEIGHYHFKSHNAASLKWLVCSASFSHEAAQALMDFHPLLTKLS